ncbi:MAG: hypothetical protein ACSHYA_18920 [Opitutaceae bacterium]
MNQEYQIDSARISYREDGYGDFWGRGADLVLHQTDDAKPHIDTYRYPKEKETEVGDMIVYLTGGMSDLIQPGMEEYDEACQRMEISTFAPSILIVSGGVKVV